MIILLAGDVESNPEPNTVEQNDTLFPCAVCVGNVSWSEDALQCEGCELWLHRSCMDMSTTEYNRLGQESSIWLCCNCGLRNMASSLFRSRHLDSQTTHDSSAFSLGSISSPGEPLHMSSPEKVPRPKSVKGKPSLNIVNVNCQSISAKRLPFELMINRVKPDVVIGTESWLHSKIGNETVFPVDDYQIFRRDRERDNTKGGVFILAKNDVTITTEEELETACEILWCKVEVHGSRNLHIGAYYRPHERDEESLDQLTQSLQRLGKNSEHVILGGDFNFPGMDWKNGGIKPDCRTPTTHNRFQDLLDDVGMTQMVEDPTRERYALDLICTNLPGKINKIDIIPGISDHCIPTAEVDVRPIKRHQKPRRINLYKKAEWNKMAEELDSTRAQIEESKDTKTVNELWLMFKEAVTSAVKKFVPSKICKKRERLRYMTSEIAKLIRRRDPTYKKRQKARQNFDRSSPGYQNADKKLKLLKKEIQTKLRQAYWKYIESIITPLEEDNEPTSGMKRFW